MRVGLQTITWGAALPEPKSFGRDVREAGFEGLEFAQRVAMLGPATAWRDALAQYQLVAIGLAGGALADRVSYAHDLGCLYLYADEWDEAGVAAAIKTGLRIGLHPHVYKEMDTVAKAEVYLGRFPELGLVLDTAHLYLAGDDFLGALKRYASRVWAVHLKDWSSRYGIAPLRFARGFTSLGDGDLASFLDDVVCCLQEIHYQGWLVVEQDHSSALSPFESAKRSRAWLHERKI